MNEPFPQPPEGEKVRHARCGTKPLTLAKTRKGHQDHISSVVDKRHRITFPDFVNSIRDWRTSPPAPLTRASQSGLALCSYVSSSVNVAAPEPAPPRPLPRRRRRAHNEQKIALVIYGWRVWKLGAGVMMSMRLARERVLPLGEGTWPRATPATKCTKTTRICYSMQT